MSAYQVSLRELRFFLWELCDAEAAFLSHAPYRAHDRAYYDRLLERARDFALEIGESYRASDIESCSLRDDGTVRIPADFHALWPRFRDEWRACCSIAIRPRRATRRTRTCRWSSSKRCSRC